MSEDPKGTATPNTDAAQDNQESLLENAGQESNADGKSILDEAGDEARKQELAEEKRLLDAKDEDLSAEDKEKKATIVKAKEEARVKAEADAKAKAVPEKYELKAPEGMQLDTNLIEKATPIFKDLKLSNEQAQKLVEFYANAMKSSADAQADNFKKFLDESRQETIKELGADYKEKLAFAAKARDRLFSPETLELINASGLGNNKSLILDLIKIGRLISEDKLVEGKREIPSAEKSAAETMYPDLARK